MFIGNMIVPKIVNVMGFKTLHHLKFCVSLFSLKLTSISFFLSWCYLFHMRANAFVLI